MFSIIVCSISPHKAEALKRNIGNTASMPFEMLIFDNRQVGMGICAVYNKMAEQAKYNNLLFVHEDIVFHTYGWDRVLADKFAETDCGVIGFAGGTSKYPFPYGWGSSKRFIHRNYIQDFSINESKHIKESADEPFTEVITLDGMFLAARKDVWSKCRFDDKTFSGFHSYDTDFSTSVYVAGFKNYVCNDVIIEHQSTGSFSKSWYQSELTYLQKWQSVLPLYITPRHTAEEMAEQEQKIEYRTLKRLFKLGILSREEALAAIKEFRKSHPFSIYSLLLISKLPKS